MSTRPPARILVLVAITTVSSVVMACRTGEPVENRNLTILMDKPPVTLNPRATLDASGQRLSALLFAALIRIDKDLAPQPDLASSWHSDATGKIWKFPIRPGLTDHAGQPITAAKIRACLEGYRAGSPPSLLRGSFQGWESTTLEKDAVILRFAKPQPYLPRNASLLRYFVAEGASEPCTEPPSEGRLIGSGHFRADPWNSAPDTELNLAPVKPEDAPIRFVFIQDENTKALKLIRGEVDVIQNALSLTKIRWLEKDFSNRFRVIERDGVNVSYLSFNVRDPLLAKREVRLAISLAIDREEITRTKLNGFCTPAGSLLSPMLPESHQTIFKHDPARAEALLDEAGFPRKKDGWRIRLRYRTTPVREGLETALLLQEMLRKAGIDLIIDVVEPAVFLASIRRGRFQLYSSRWIGISDASILHRTLHSNSTDNRVGYKSPAMDELLEQAMAELNQTARAALMGKAQALMAYDLPYFPLWRWNNALIARRDIEGLAPDDLSLSGGLEPLTRLRLRPVGH